MEAFTFPAAFASAATLFSKPHWESCKSATPPIFKSTASDGLTLYAVVGKFFQDVLLQRLHNRDDIAKKVTSYHRLCEIVDLLQLSRLGSQICPDLLDRTIVAWRQARAAAYGNTMTYLKTHLTSHLPDCLRRRLIKNVVAVLIACWCLDRVH